MKKIICFIFLGQFCISCSYKKQEMNIILKNHSTDNVQLTAIPLYNDSIIWDSKIIGFLDNKVILECQNCDLVYDVFSFSDDKLQKEGSFGKKGQGPHEISYSNCTIDNTNKKLYLYDIGKNHTFYQIDIDVFSNVYTTTDNWTQIFLPKMEDTNFWKSFISVDDNTFIGLGGSIEKNNLISMIYPDNNKIIPIDVEFPSDGIVAKSIIKRMVYNNGNILKRPSSNQYLYFCSEGNYAEIITLTNDFYRKDRNIIVGNYPNYEMLSDGMNFNYIRDGLNGLKCYITDNYIYILPFSFQDKDEDNYKGYPKGYSDLLYVFNWEGDFVHSYELNTPIATFAVDENDSFFIATTLNIADGEYSFKKFYFKK